MAGAPEGGVAEQRGYGPPGMTANLLQNLKSRTRMTTKKTRRSQSQRSSNWRRRGETRRRPCHLERVGQEWVL